MAEIDGGRIAARQLRAAGIDTVFGVVAGPMIELFAGAAAEGLRVVGCRHEENEGFMASAWGWPSATASSPTTGETSASRAKWATAARSSFRFPWEKPAHESSDRGG